MSTITIIINGQTGCGKDQLIDFAQQTMGKDKIQTESSIDPIKEIIRNTVGLNEEKTDIVREFIHTLKIAYTKYCDLPNRYLFTKYEEANSNGAIILFVHIKEPEEIARFRKLMAQNNKPTTALLIKSQNSESNNTTSRINIDVNDYEYDYVFENNDDLNITGPMFVKLINTIIQQTT